MSHLASKVKAMFVALVVLAFCLPLIVQARSAGNALDFDGVDDYVSADNASGGIAGQSAMSISGWVYPTRADVGWPALEGFFGFRNDTDADFYILCTDATSLEARFRNSDGDYYDVIYSGTLALNQWQYWTLTYISPTLTLYLNGNSVGSTFASGVINSSAETLWLGRLGYSGWEFYLRGKLDEVSLWSKALTPVEINSAMYDGLTGAETGLEIFYNFDQGTPGGDNTNIIFLNDSADAGGAANGALSNFALSGDTSNWVSNTLPDDPLESDIGFRPSADGYSFFNYASTVQDDDPPPAILIDLLGASTVCISGTVSTDGASCTLNVTTKLGVRSVTSQSYGQAYGMAVSSLRLFSGADAPSDLISGITQTTQLSRETSVENNIYRYTLQFGMAPLTPTLPNGWDRNQTASQALGRISGELAKGKAAADPYIMMLQEQSGANALTVVPYKITRIGGGVYDLFVYDVNHPLDNARQVRFDLSTTPGSWTYTSTLPGSGQVITLSSKTDGRSYIDLRHLSVHQKYGLRIAGSQTVAQFMARVGQAAQPRLMQSGEPVAFRSEGCLTAQGGISMTNAPDAEGHCDQLPASGSFQCVRVGDGLDTSQGGRGQDLICGIESGVASDTNYTLYPEQNAYGLSTVSNNGNVIDLQATQTTSGALRLRALNADSGLAARVDSSGSQAAVTAPGGVGVVMNISFAARAQTANQPDCISSISGLTLTAGSQITGQMDTAAGRFYLNAGDSVVTYTVKIERVKPDGTTDIFIGMGIVQTGAAAYLDFGNWVGGDPMNMYVDTNGDGSFGDETPTPLQNDAQFLYRSVTLAAPANGYTASVGSGITLTWDAVTDASGYRLTVNGVTTDAGNVITYPIGLLAAGAYSWTVTAYNPVGDTHAAAPRAFVLLSAAPTVVTLTALSVNTPALFGGGLCGSITFTDTTPTQVVITFTHEFPTRHADGLARFYQIAAPGGGTAQVQLCYTDAELLAAGLNEAELHIYRYVSDVGWQMYSTVEPVNNTITADGVTAFGAFGIGSDTNQPTAVALQSLETSRGSDSVAIYGFALLALGAFFILRKRKPHP